MVAQKPRIADPGWRWWLLLTVGQFFPQPPQPSPALPEDSFPLWSPEARGLEHGNVTHGGPGGCRARKGTCVLSLGRTRSVRPGRRLSAWIRWAVPGGHQQGGGHVQQVQLLGWPGRGQVTARPGRTHGCCEMTTVMLKEESEYRPRPPAATEPDSHQRAGTSACAGFSPAGV